MVQKFDITGSQNLVVGTELGFVRWVDGDGVVSPDGEDAIDC